MEKGKELLERTAELFDLPADRLAGVPRVELVGDSELWMFHHRGILAFGTVEFHISGGKLLVRASGLGLELRSMNADELLITGTIRRVDIE